MPDLTNALDWRHLHRARIDEDRTRAVAADAHLLVDVLNFHAARRRAAIKGTSIPRQLRSTQSAAHTAHQAHQGSAHSTHAGC